MSAAPWMTAPIAVPDGEVRLRPERAGDTAFLAALFRATAAPLAGLPPEMAEALLEMQFRSQRSDYQAAYPHAWPAIIERGGEAAGRLLVAPGDPALIVDYALLPGTQNRGLGGAILAEILARMGVRTRATVLADNRACLAMCARLGFRVVAETPPHLRLEWCPPALTPSPPPAPPDPPPSPPASGISASSPSPSSGNPPRT